MARKQIPATRCECSLYEVLTNVREETEGGDLIWDGEYTTGCVATTRNTFAPGHDAKLKSFLIAWGAQGEEVRKNLGGMVSVADAQTHADKYEFAHMVASGIKKAKEKLAAKRDRAAKKAAKATKPSEAVRLADVVAAEEAAYAAQQAAAVPTPDWDDEKPSETPSEDVTDDDAVICKVGRWEYRGYITDGTFYYLAKDGHTRKETDKYTFLRNV